MTSPSRTPRTPSRCAGFSFIEILVVMGIIAVLAGLGVVIIQIWVKRGPKVQTQNLINKVKGSIDQFKQRYYDYPPMTLLRLEGLAGTAAVKSLPNDRNTPNEALYQALSLDGFAGAVELSEGDWANLDDDRIPVKITTRGGDLREIVDAWGNPLVYIVNTEYVKAFDHPSAYDKRDGGDFEPKPWKEEGGGFVNPNGYQLFSIGEDGQPNTDDDIKAW